MPEIETPNLIAVTFALPEESRDFLAKLEGRRVVRAGALPVITGDLNGRRIVICHTGVGPESCAKQIALFLKEHRPGVLISSGFAGGLDPALKIGDVLVAWDVTKNGEIKVTTQPRAAETVAEKAALFAQTGAAAVDMETAVILEHCKRAGIAMHSLRSISDAAGDELPVPFPVWFDAAKQKPRVGALLWHLAMHPGKIPRFGRFVRGISLARAQLTGALAAFIEGLK